MTVRCATPNDTPAITAIINHVIRETLVTFTTKEKTLEGMSKQIAEMPFFVWDVVSGIQGYASYGPFRAGDGYDRTVEYSIAINADAAGQGIGRALLSAVSDHARAGGKTTLIGGVSAANADGIAFHVATGFTQTGLLPGVGHKFGHPQDLVIMQKRL